MKPATTLITLLFSSLAVAKSVFPFGGDQAILDDDLNVPGANPLQFCQKPEDYSLTINHVNLSPNPPKPGKTLIIEAKGNFTQNVAQGAYVQLSVKYGLITLIRQTTDLCEQMKQVEEECPLEGEKAFTKSVEIPGVIPPGHYKVTADVYSEDDEHVTCLVAEVHF